MAGPLVSALGIYSPNIRPDGSTDVAPNASHLAMFIQRLDGINKQIDRNNTELSIKHEKLYGPAPKEAESSKGIQHSASGEIWQLFEVIERLEHLSQVQADLISQFDSL